jgi:SET domain-containing protein
MRRRSTAAPVKRKQQKDFKVFKSSAGFGIRALRDFAAEEELMEYTGPRLTNEEADRRAGRYLFRLNDDYTIDGTPRSNLARYINHSCAPNAQASLSHDEKRIIIEAIRPIRAGEEITYDYGEEYFEQYIAPAGCKCIKCEPASDE